jgi:hypothetical protein
VKKVTVSVLVALVAAMVAQWAFATTKYAGKCAKKAEDAAIQYWADTPNADDTEYLSVSSKVTRARDTYLVVLALNNQGEPVYIQYEVTFGNVDKCSDPTVKTSR